MTGLVLLGLLVGILLSIWDGIDLMLDAFGSGVRVDLLDYPRLWLGLVLIIICATWLNS